ncbi:NAD(P)/FAD-dependent oxidoreductase [Natronomonas marina]|jgi:renalase|uniref:NAD(P)/FAD-dependent oxidoreductase n=1 Tax=Natronomonas marina TaxID=2961939 RepID=UPI0020CA09C9|nr:FAD-dependent oxidoreductase [Natronomonas marina]
MDLAIVGAGAAGAATAYALRDTDHDVTVFEKSRGVCGRGATRRREDCTYDHGANYVRPDSDRVTELVTETLPTAGLVDIEEPVWTFDAAGRISESDRPDAHKWSYEAGITQLAKRLFEAADAEVTFETRVGRLERDDSWRLLDVDGERLGRFDAVVLTPPAPQTAELLAETAWSYPLREDLVATVEAVPYRTVYSVLLHYPFELDYPWYGLVNDDREHEVGWLSREECKRGHVPDGESLLVAQMSPAWSTRRYDDPSEAVKADAASIVADLLDDDRLADPDWTDRQGWRYALPDDGVDTGPLRAAEGHGLYFAGDWVAGDGRVHLAVESGLDAGERIVNARGE